MSDETVPTPALAGATNQDTAKTRGLADMVTRAEFSTQEWDTLQSAIEESMAAALLAGGGSMVAVGDLRKADAVDHEIPAADMHSEFVEQVGDLSQRHGVGVSQSQDSFAYDASKRLKDAVRILQAKAPAELPAYRELVIDMATTAAETSRKGVFGVTATGLSAAQAEAIEKLKSAMNVAMGDG
jgi:hypothetical protein